ncbi:carboxypeptidase-like regulatory domain-containing protein [Poritiphilus flavus]|uniref:Tetratricopeptide repeat protein n=1 Tax=Poritiphilus flavus TaxID=2697053 RepID=A0A6L9EFH0_9FLAO|nr:carboxypeptidase-like regulatory domain-containing protein [Poritiphilus flavus]NAS13456.1 tetratricopeptide repeat protein [Poritiphilus flavus]
MKRFVFLLLCFPLVVLSQNSRSISGKITDGRNAIDNVNVSVVDKDVSTATGQDGVYKIDAEIGDILQYSYTGMKTLRIRVEDVTRILNPVMTPDVEALDEVVVFGSNRKSQNELAQEYTINKRLIRTAYGILDADTAPGRIRFLHEENINPVGLCILDMLKARFAGVRVVGGCIGATGPTLEQSNTNLTGNDADNSGNAIGRTLASERNEIGGLGKVFIRGANSITNQRSAIFDVDGIIFEDAPIWLDIKNIKRLAILNNFATTTMYGSAAAGGVVVINTHNGSPNIGKIVDQARLRNNYASGPLLTQEQVRANGPSYLQELRGSASRDAAMAAYDKYSKAYASSPYFHMDVAEYFSDRWNDPGVGDALIEKKAYLFENNAVLLKALGYQYQEEGRFEKAHEIFQKVLKLRPNYAQSYMDVANSYRDLGKNKQAASIYTRYEYLVNEGMMPSDSAGFGTIIEREYNNLLMLNKSEVVPVTNVKSLYIAQEDFQGTRLVFEWNDSEAEFELQFVNPGNQYFVWKHTLADTDELIMKEKDLGYACTEYLIDESLPGEWQINIKYLGNKSLTPTYLKATIYDNYGKRSQRKEVRVFKLTLKGTNQELFTLAKSAAVVSR